MATAAQSFTSSPQGAPRTVISLICRQSQVDLSRAKARDAQAQSATQRLAPVSLNQLLATLRGKLRVRVDLLQDKTGVIPGGPARMSVASNIGRSELVVRTYPVRQLNADEKSDATCYGVWDITIDNSVTVRVGGQLSLSGLVERLTPLLVRLTPSATSRPDRSGGGRFRHCGQRRTM